MRKLKPFVFAFAMLIMTSVFAVNPVYAAEAWDGITADTSWYDSAKASKTAVLKTAEEFAGFAKILSDASGESATGFSKWTIKLGADIDLGNHPISITGVFRGVFDGDGYTLSNAVAENSFDYTATSIAAYGLFPIVSEMAGSGFKPAIKNLTVDSLTVNASFKSGNDLAVGGLVGFATNTASGDFINGCKIKDFKVNISGTPSSGKKAYVGTVIGAAQDGVRTIKDVTVYVSSDYPSENTAVETPSHNDTVGLLYGIDGNTNKKMVSADITRTVFVNCRTASAYRLSVDVSWGSFTYIYSDSTKWDPDKLVMTGGTRWEPSDENSGKITVKNYSSVDIRMLLSYRASAGYEGVKAEFDRSEHTVSQDGGSETSTLTVKSGALTESGKNKIGTVTLVIKAATVECSEGINSFGVNYKVTDKIGTINKISDLNKGVTTADDHAGNTQYSHLMPDYRSNYTVSYDGGQIPQYTRVKKLNDGRYMLVYIDGGSKGIIFRTSYDLVNWTDSKRVFSTYKNSYGNDVMFYSPDALVLEDGTIMVVATYHDYQDYYGDNATHDLNRSGIAIVTSKDGGNTWSASKTIYTGINWEPMLLQLKSGEIQCYFTHTAPYIAKYGYLDVRSTGSALIRSKDGGATWTPNITGAASNPSDPYAAHRVMQTSVGNYKGIPYFTDQMPVAVELNNGKIALVCESQTLDKKFHISVGITSDNWKTPLGITEGGPYDKYDIVNSSDTLFSGPYIGQFKSGETVIHLWKDSGYALYLGDENAHSAKYAATVDFNGRVGNYWSNFEIISDHSLLAASVYRAGEDPELKYYYGNGIVLQMCHLNHNIKTAKRTVTVDGDPSDWENTDDALFVGSKSQAQATLRVSEDSRNFYFLVERLDNSIETGDDTTLVFTCDGEKLGYYRLVIKPSGEVYVEDRGQGWGKINTDIAMVVVKGDRGDEGYAVEVAVPKSALTINGNIMNVDLIIDNYDGGVRAAKESMYPDVAGELVDRGRVIIG